MENGKLEKIRGYYVTDFINYLVVERNLAKRTVKEYERDIRLFLGFFEKYLEAEMTLNDFDERTIREYLTHLKLDLDYSPRAINRKLAAIKSYFKFIEQERFIEHSPANNIKNTKLDKRLPKVLDEDDVDRLIDTTEEVCLEKTPDEYDPENYKSFVYLRDCAIMEILYATGMRISELVNLDIKDIDFKNKTARVTGKGSKQRMVLLNDPAIKALDEYLAVRPDVSITALFLNRYKNKLSARSVEKMFKKNMNRSGVGKPASPHTMRHSFATHLLQGGSDVVTIKELLGHESLATTQIYTNISMNKIKATYENAHPRAKLKENKKNKEDNGKDK